MTRGLAVALAAGFLAGGIGAQSFAPLPAYAAPMMGAPDSRGGVKEAPPLLPRDEQLFTPCSDYAKLDVELGTGEEVVCDKFVSGLKWAPVPGGVMRGPDVYGSPCSQPWKYSRTTDQHLLTCQGPPFTNQIWTLGKGTPPIAGPPSGPAP
jgi:hypothetical protein